VYCLKLLFADPQTEAVVLIAEIGGTEEQQAADYIRRANIKKPVVALVVGKHAPPRRRMGHAGALAQDAPAAADSKTAALRDAGTIIAPSPHLVGTTTRDLIARRAA
jgi:succinyl-CoA synthetase alpha subunit